MKNKVTIIRFDRVNNVENKEERVRILSERKNISFFRVRCSEIVFRENSPRFRIERHE